MSLEPHQMSVTSQSNRSFQAKQQKLLSFHLNQQQIMRKLPSMNYQDAAKRILKEPGVEWSSLMKTPCLRYRGEFLAMWFKQANALIIKVSSTRVNQLIESKAGREFNFTKKRFKEWVLIPISEEEHYLSYLNEALHYAQSRIDQKNPKQKPH